MKKYIDIALGGLHVLRLAVEETESAWRLEQFDAGECIEGALDNGETFGKDDLTDGVTGITCKRSEDGGMEVQALVFTKEQFPTADDCKEWAESNSFVAWLQQRQKRSAFAKAHADKAPKVFRGSPATVQVDGRTAFEQDMPDGELLESDSITQLLDELNAAIATRGWTSYTNPAPEFDFYIDNVWETHMVCMDIISAQHYLIAYTVAGDGTVQLGMPEPVDIAYKAAGAGQDTADVEPEPDDMTMAAGRKPKKDRARLRGYVPAPTLLRPAKFAADGTTLSEYPIWEILACSEGWTADGRYVQGHALIEAVNRGMFDGVPVNWQHPDEHTGQRRGVPVGAVLPGRVRYQKNAAGLVDVYVAVMLNDTDMAQECNKVLRFSKQQNVQQIGASVYSVTLQEAKRINGRFGVSNEKFYAIEALDFVDKAAFPRSEDPENQRRLAASRRPADAPGGTLNNSPKGWNMDKEKELQAAKDKVAELESANALLAKEKHVADLLRDSGLPKDEQEPLQVLLMTMDSKETREAYCKLEVSRSAKMLALAKGTKLSVTTTDDGDGAPDPLPERDRSVFQKALDRFRVKPEVLTAAHARMRSQNMSR